jgi:predicted nucleotidyltransferase
MAGPTAYPDLNAVLEELVSSVRAILGDNFCAAYLQGSFALGEADEHSDVDFVVATHDQVSDEQVAELQPMHARIYALDTSWAQHLEGSYVPKDRLRRVDREHTRFLFLDNGASELVLDDHCNTAVVRWVLREHGVVLAGPDPVSLIDPVAPEQLREEALRMIGIYVEWANESQEMSRWRQPYLVLTLCRMLHTLHAGVVGSKREAAEWAFDALDREWTTLIQRAIDDRPDPWLRVHQPADPEVAARTREFADYAATFRS